MKKLLAAVVLAVAAAGCSNPTPQDVMVTMGGGNCDIQPAELAAGTVNFTVRNLDTQPVTFAVTENGDEKVGDVTVASVATDTLSVHLDDDDTYHFQCGDVSGPDIRPGG